MPSAIVSSLDDRIFFATIRSGHRRKATAVKYLRPWRHTMFPPRREPSYFRPLVFRASGCGHVSLRPVRRENVGTFVPSFSAPRDVSRLPSARLSEKTLIDCARYIFRGAKNGKNAENALSQQPANQRIAAVDRALMQYLQVSTPYQRPTNALLTPTPRLGMPNVNYIVHDIFFEAPRQPPTDSARRRPSPRRALPPATPLAAQGYYPKTTWNF